MTVNGDAIRRVMSDMASPMFFVPGSTPMSLAVAGRTRARLSTDNVVAGETAAVERLGDSIMGHEPSMVVDI